MTRGRRPKPTRLKEVTGNPGKRALNHDEPELPEPRVEFDEPPLELEGDKVAAAEWRRLAPMLRKARVVTEGDRASLIAACTEWSRYLTANEGAKKAGPVVATPAGYPMQNPHIAIAGKALAMCVKLWGELGLTPSSRSRVKVGAGDGSSGDGQPKSPLAAILAASRSIRRVK